MLQWMAYQSVNRDNGYTNRRAIPVYTTGTVCVDQEGKSKLTRTFRVLLVYLPSTEWFSINCRKSLAFAVVLLYYDV